MRISPNELNFNVEEAWLDSEYSPVHFDPCCNEVTTAQYTFERCCLSEFDVKEGTLTGVVFQYMENLRHEIRSCQKTKISS